MLPFKDDDDEGGEAFDLSKMERDEEDDMAGVKVHEIKFDEYGIMDDGVDDSTADKLKAAGVSEGGASPCSLMLLRLIKFTVDGNIFNFIAIPYHTIPYPIINK